MSDRPLDAIPEEPRRSEGRAIVLRLLAAAVVLVGGYVALAYYVGARIPSGTTVEGVDVGTLTKGGAEDLLSNRLSEMLTAPVVVSVGREQLQLEPEQAGLSVDYDATLRGLGGRSFDPRDLWGYFDRAGGPVPLRTTVDEQLLAQTLRAAAPELAVEPVEGQVVLANGEVSTTLPKAGREVDVEATTEQLAGQWPQQHAVEAAVTEVPSTLSEAQVEEFVDEVARPAIAKPVVVVVEGTVDKQPRATLNPNQLSRLLRVEQQDDAGGGVRLRLVMDDEGMLEVVRGALADVERAPVDASVRLSDQGRPEIVPAQVGVQLRDDSVLSGLREILGVPAPADQVEAMVRARTVTARTLQTQPDITAEDAAQWRVDTVMAEFASQFPTGPENAGRTENIRVGLRYLDGLVVSPGQQFSLADTLAPISPQRGYVDAGVIRDGRLVKGIGGGLSQVSTTMLNTAWFAGVQLDEFTPHSYYIARYPVGREATISVGQIDNKWTNDTDSPIVVQTFIEDDVIMMRFWGDRQYTVETETGPRREVKEPEEFEDDATDCLTQGAVEGFTITVTRTLLHAGDRVRTEPYTTTYRPSPGVTCATD